jgi:hypothetical protein
LAGGGAQNQNETQAAKETWHIIDVNCFGDAHRFGPLRAKNVVTWIETRKAEP